MPTLAYPQPMVAPHGPFPPINDIQKSERAKVDTLRRRIGAIHLGDVNDLNPVNLRHAPSPLVGVTQLHISVGGDHSTSFHNGGDTLKPVAIVPFAFCPGEDPVTISWKVRNKAFIAAATLEIYAARLDGPVCSVDVTTQLANGNGVSPGATGGIGLTAAMQFTGTHTAKFAGGVLTVEHSPYRFVLRIRLKLGVRRECYPSAAWTFGHVLAESIELSWGTAQMLPHGTLPGVIDPLGDNRYNSLERDLVTSLATGALTAPTIPVVLKTNVFTATKLDIAERVGSPFNSNHDAVSKIWGAGPRIPLRAKVHVAKHDGSRAGPQNARKVLGTVCVLWDWEDDAAKFNDWIAGTQPHFPYVSREYLKRVFELPDPNGPPGSSNCPVAHGGKRGDLLHPVFPPIGATDPFGYEVRAAGGGRPWASVGVTGTGFKSQVSSVIFQPAPIGGDRYKVSAYLTADPADPLAARDDKPMMALADVTALVPPAPLLPPPGVNDPPVPAPVPPQLSAAAAAAPGGHATPSASTGLFEIRRWATIRVYEHPVGSAAGSLVTVAGYYKNVANFVLDFDVKPLPADILVQSWPTYVTKALSQSQYNLILHFGIDNPQRNIGPGQILQILTFPQFTTVLKALVRTGHVYTVGWKGIQRLGEPIVGNPNTSFILQLGDTHMVVVTADPTTALTADTATLAGRTFGEFKRHLFGLPIVKVVQFATPNERTVRVEFSAAGQTQTVTLEFSRIILSKNPLPSGTPARFVQALRDLEAAIPNGQALDGPITVTLRGQWNHEKPASWRPAIRDAATAAIAETFVTLDVDGLVRGFLNSPHGSKGQPLTAESYTETLRVQMKPIVQNLTTYLRRTVDPGFDGSVYLSLLDPVTIGNAGIGGNYLSEPVGAGYVTQFPGAGFWLQAGYGMTDVLGHEIGHAFWRPHAEAAIFGTAYGTGANINEHVPDDTCLMNYDPEGASLNFCAACLLSLRGWKDPPARLFDVAESSAQLEREIAAEGNGETRGWLQLRRALISARAAKTEGATVTEARQASEAAWKKSPRDAVTATTRANDGVQATGRESGALTDIRTWLYHAEHSFGGAYDQGGGMGVSFLRSMIRGRIRAGDIDGAWRLWGELRNRTTLWMDICDAEFGVLRPMLPGVVQSVAVRENNADVAHDVRQYINLPAEAKFVDGVKVTHADRTGVRVRFRATVNGTPNAVDWALLGHSDNPHAPHEKITSGRFANAAPGYTLAHLVGRGAPGEAPLMAIPNGSAYFDVQVTLPGPGRYKLAFLGVGGVVLSPEVTALRMIFAMATVLSRATGSATDFGAAVGALQTAYGPAGFDVVDVGSEPLAWADVPLADDYNASQNTKALGTAAEGTRDLACRIPFTPGIVTYRDLQPYLYQFLYADVLMHWAGVGRYSQDVDVDRLNARVLLPVKGRNGNGAGMLWQGTPAGLNALQNLGQGAYIGQNVVGKNWLIRGSFRVGNNPAQDLLPGDVEGRESDAVTYAGRYDRIEVDLTRFAPIQGGNIQGRLSIEVLVASFRGGVDMREHTPTHAMAMVTTVQSWSGHASSAQVQQSIAIHELGHSLGMVVSDGTNPNFYTIGGPHCSAGVPPPMGLGIDDGHYNTNVAHATCVMFHRVRQIGPLVAYCDACKAQLRRLPWERFG